MTADIAVIFFMQGRILACAFLRMSRLQRPASRELKAARCGNQDSCEFCLKPVEAEWALVLFLGCHFDFLVRRCPFAASWTFYQIVKG